MTARRLPHIHTPLEENGLSESLTDTRSSDSSEEEQLNNARTVPNGNHTRYQYSGYHHLVILPSTSDFGPQSLKTFMTGEIRKQLDPWADFVARKGKGKAKQDKEADIPKSDHTRTRSRALLSTGQAQKKNFEIREFPPNDSSDEDLLPDTLIPPVRYRFGPEYVGSQARRPRHDEPFTNISIPRPTLRTGRRQRHRSTFLLPGSDNIPANEIYAPNESYRKARNDRLTSFVSQYLDAKTKAPYEADNSAIEPLNNGPSETTHVPQLDSAGSDDRLTDTSSRTLAFQEYTELIRRLDHSATDQAYPTPFVPGSSGLEADVDDSRPHRKGASRSSLIDRQSSFHHSDICRRLSVGEESQPSEGADVDRSVRRTSLRMPSAVRSSSEPGLHRSRSIGAGETPASLRLEDDTSSPARPWETLWEVSNSPSGLSPYLGSSMSGLSDLSYENEARPNDNNHVVSAIAFSKGLNNGMGDDRKQFDHSTRPVDAFVARTFPYEDVVPESTRTAYSFDTSLPETSLSKDTMHGKQRTGSVATISRFIAPLGSKRNPVKIPRAFDRSTKTERDWLPCLPPVSVNAPPMCKVSSTTQSLLGKVSGDVWCIIGNYLSSDDIRQLRLVDRNLATTLAPLMFRSCVSKFGKSFFHPHDFRWNIRTGIPPQGSIFDLYGKEINKFGISFDYDFWGLATAKAKQLQKEQSAWFGNFTWPVDRYPRYSTLQELEDLADDNGRLLRGAMAKLTKVSELGLSLNSGHGWMNGPDISDLALFEKRLGPGTPVFGRSFPAEDPWHTLGRHEYFRWAQQNSINESIKALRAKDPVQHASKIEFMQRVQVRDYESFRDTAAQPDYNPDAHTGDDPQFRQILHNPAGQNGAPFPGPPGAAFGGAFPWPGPNPNAFLAAAHQPVHAFHGRQRPGRNTRSHDSRRRRKSPRPAPIIPQWPLVFSAHNIAAEVGGHLGHIRDKVEPLIAFPINPALLTEPQAQWLLETAWAQCAFLSAYTSAIIMNKHNFSGVHTLHIVQFSSGLLGSLEQRKFWASLPSLRTLRILVKPDWRKEHVPHDPLYQANMMVGPTQASIGFAEFLRDNIARIENLSTLTIGFCGGGEHAPGIFARNQHVLPAPITTNPLGWLSNHSTTPDINTMIKFDHIKNLTFENCWLSPCMLESFMVKSQDTSLRELTLDSVSLTGKHKPNTTTNPIEQPLTTVSGDLKCVHDANHWLHEVVPTRIACWVETLDKITPGKTLLECKYVADMIDEDIHPKPAKEFRGNVETIHLKSCGYVTVACRADTLGQGNVVLQYKSAMDEALRKRQAMLSGKGQRTENPDTNTDTHLTGLFSRRATMNRVTENANVMMSTIDSISKDAWFGLGKLTQCVHPIEKRVLEGMWGMEFGWGNNMARWAAVEDGCFEGGTGRFSGVIRKDDGVNVG